MISECYPNSLPLYASAVSAADRLVQSCITAKNSPWYCWGDAGCEERVLVFVIVCRQNKKGWKILGHWTNIIIVSFVKIQLIYQFALVASLKLYDIIRVALHCVIISYNIQVLHFWSKEMNDLALIENYGMLISLLLFMMLGIIVWENRN